MPGRRSARRIGKPEWKTDPGLHDRRGPPAAHHVESSRRSRSGSPTKTKFEAVDILRKFDIPCSPVLSMKEIANDPSLRASGTVVEVDA